MPLDEWDRHFKHLARDGTNAADPEFLEVICILRFRVYNIVLCMQYWSSEKV
jgi:hypothetical protein